MGGVGKVLALVIETMGGPNNSSRDSSRGDEPVWCSRVGEGAERLFLGPLEDCRFSFNLLGNRSNSGFVDVSIALPTKVVFLCHTLSADEHLSAAWLILARPARASFPSFASARISRQPSLSGCSKT